MAGGVLWGVGAVGVGGDLQAEEVGGGAFIEDEEELKEQVIAREGFEGDDLVDLGLEKSVVGCGHFGLVGARKLTVERRTTMLFWLMARVRVRTMP